MDLSNKQIIDELENINEQEKNIVKKTDDVQNNWSRLKVKRSWWYLGAEIILGIIVCLIGFEIALLIETAAQTIWNTNDSAKSDLYSMIFGLCMTFLNLGVYLILMYKGKEDYTFNDVALKNGIVYKKQNSVSKKSYWISNFALIVLIINFFMFYGYVGSVSKNADAGSSLQAISAVLAVLSITVPAATVPLAMQYINKHSAERKVEKRYHDWMRLNAASKYAVLKKVNFDNKIDYLELSNQLGIDKNIIVIDEKSTGDVKKNIILYNNIKLQMLEDLLKNYSDNVAKRSDLYKQLKWKRDKIGNIKLNKTLRNTSITNKIKKYNKKNDVLISVMYDFYEQKFDY